MCNQTRMSCPICYETFSLDCKRVELFCGSMCEKCYTFDLRPKEVVQDKIPLVAWVLIGFGFLVGIGCYVFY